MKNIILLFFILAFSSCTLFKPNSLYENRQILSKDNLKKFEGTFRVVSKDTLENVLDSSSIKKLTLKLIDKNHIKFETVKDTTLVESEIVKFRLRRNYLFLKRTRYIKSIVIINSKVVFRSRICLSQEGNLITDDVYSSSVFLFIMPFNDVRAEYYGLEFERIE